MLYKCGKKCFLGPKVSFPICTKGTCKINKKGAWAAYIRASQWKKGKPQNKKKYSQVVNKAKKIIKLNAKKNYKT